LQANIGKLKEEWFKRSDKYWSSCEATNDGVLGGYGHLHEIDINFSKEFLNEVLQLDP
jgi:protein N-terminal methyltransferase